MSDTAKVAKNLERFRQGVFAHDRENPTHTAYGVGLSRFDMDRLGFDEGEELWPSIRVECDGGQSANFRVLCDGDHNESTKAVESTSVTNAVGVEA